MERIPEKEIFNSLSFPLQLQYLKKELIWGFLFIRFVDSKHEACTVMIFSCEHLFYFLFNNVMRNPTNCIEILFGESITTNENKNFNSIKDRIYL